MLQILLDIVRRNRGGMVVSEYRLFLMIDLSLYSPKVKLFRGCAKCCRLAFFQIQDGHRQPDLV